MIWPVQCLHEKKGDTVLCDDHMHDYMECLHHKKEVRGLLRCAMHVAWASCQRSSSAGH